MIKLAALTMILLAAMPAPSHSPAPKVSASLRPAAESLSPDELFSRRALRRARLLIQMRLMQLRDERLECVRQALLRHLPDALWPEIPSPSRGTAGAAGAAEHCAQLLRF